jgi:hypothetical protein
MIVCVSTRRFAAHFLFINLYCLGLLPPAVTAAEISVPLRVPRYLKTDAIPLAEETGEPAHIPRATYCVYNAGPKAARRFLGARGSARARAVDERLWKLYHRGSSPAGRSTCNSARS